jgi:hypothetical protein
MNASITELLESKLTAKKKAKAIADALLSGTLKPEALSEASPKLPDAELAIVMESLEGATRKKPELVNGKLFTHLVDSLGHAAPRVQWEAARTISNVAKQHAEHLESAVEALLANTTSDGTVVRWATAQALTAILRVGYTDDNFRVKLSEIAAKEQDDGVRGVYDKALRARH